MHLPDGTTTASAGLVVGYALVTLGVAGGLLLRGARWPRIALAPLLALPVTVIAALLVAVLAATLARLRVPLSGIPLAMGGALLMALSGLVAGLAPTRRTSRERLRRGTRIERAPPLARARAAEVRFAGVPVPAGDEAKHFKLIGTTGTGKSTAIRGLLEGGLARGDRFVVADPDGGYAARYYDAGRGDLILNPFDTRACRWDLFGELQEAYDCDQLARALVADHAGEERTWRAYARVFLASLLRQLQLAGRHDIGTLYRLLVIAPETELAVLLDGTAAGPFLSDDNARFFASVRAIAAASLGVLEHLATQRAPRAVSVRAWVRRADAGGPGRVLYLPYRAGQVATLRGLISAWLRLAIFEAMELGESDHRLWFLVDELDALGPVDGLRDALARLRKFGGRCVLGFQSIAQVSATYGAHDAQTIVENCGNTLILRCSASESGGTARFASRLIGDRELLREQVSRSAPGWFSAAHRSRTTAVQTVTEPAVLTAEIEQLPDLAGFVKLASADAWLRVDRFGSTPPAVRRLWPFSSPRP